MHSFWFKNPERGTLDFFASVYSYELPVYVRTRPLGNGLCKILSHVSRNFLPKFLPSLRIPSPWCAFQTNLRSGMQIYWIPLQSGVCKWRLTHSRLTRPHGMISTVFYDTPLPGCSFVLHFSSQVTTRLMSRRLCPGHALCSTIAHISRANLIM
jgi:hypothetical protein